MKKVVSGDFILCNLKIGKNWNGNLFFKRRRGDWNFSQQILFESYFYTIPYLVTLYHLYITIYYLYITLYVTFIILHFSLLIDQLG